ncbi:MAG: NADH-quinone oxidoreductase subunit NuoE family protein [Candidatus Njordarchaeales archaeon]
MEASQEKHLLDESIKLRRANIIRKLQNVQEAYGYLPRRELEAVSKEYRVPLSKLYGIVTFYHQFRLEPPGKVVIQICMGTACHLRGNEENYEFLRNLLKIPPGNSTSEDGLFTIQKVRCFGCCSLAPVVRVGDKLYGNMNPRRLNGIIAKLRRDLSSAD